MKYMTEYITRCTLESWHHQ